MCMRSLFENLVFNMSIDDKLSWVLTTNEVDAIVADLVQLRLEADLELVPKLPDFLGKTYPQGRCKEIRDAVFDRLQEAVQHADTPGLKLLQQRLLAGGTLEKVWGSLRDTYFQNAMVIDGWYFDVANDTVNPNKPRVEVLPLCESGFSKITSFLQFKLIAERYWNVQVYRNTICPELAPFLPFVFVDRRRSWIGEASNDMLAVAMTTQFRSVAEVWPCIADLPQDLFEHWQQALKAHRSKPFLSHSGDVLALCQRYKEQLYHLDASIRDQVVMSYLKVPKLQFEH